jgi:hypothetical protein
MEKRDMTESATDAAKSESGRTIWQVLADGTLREYSKDSYAFTLSLVDTRALYQLLKRNEALIMTDRTPEIQSILP